jgi:serine/threonine protein kinase
MEKFDDYKTLLATPLKPGKIIQKAYRLEEEVGKGCMGVVWKATDLIQETVKPDDSYVAIKFLNQDFKQYPDKLKALVREFHRYQRFNHPKIVKAYRLGRIGNISFIVMEFLKGVPLNQIIKNHPNGLSLSKAKPIIKDMAQALAHAHQKGIAHLDFKPANVFYDPKAKIAKVIDFGVARYLEPSERDETRFDPGILKALTGTYASYEMLSDLNPDQRDDVYGLACVTYELLSGKHPFKGKKATRAKYDKLSPKPLPGLNRQQNKALKRGLAFYRDDRTPTAEKFLAELFPETEKKKFALVFVMLLLVAAGFATLFKSQQSKSPEIKPTPSAQEVAIQQEEARKRAEAARLAAEQEAARKQAEAARLAAEQEEARKRAEAARLAAEQEEARKRAEEAARLAAEQEEARKRAEAARLAAEQEEARKRAEAARLAAEQEEARKRAEAARLAAEQEAAIKRAGAARSAAEPEDEQQKCIAIKYQLSLGIEPLTAEQKRFNKEHCVQSTP